MREITMADLPALLISFGSISRPARNIKKKTARFERTSKSGLGNTSASTEGPITTPAKSSPTSGGCLILWKSSPKILAATRMMTMLTNSCSVATSIHETGFL
jgi:hypothetical protein